MKKYVENKRLSKSKVERDGGSPGIKAIAVESKKKTDTEKEKEEGLKYRNTREEKKYFGCKIN